MACISTRLSVLPSFTGLRKALPSTSCSSTTVSVSNPGSKGSHGRGRFFLPVVASAKRFPATSASSSSSQARPVNAISSKVPDELVSASTLQTKPVLETDPLKLWNRYLEWLYQDKDLGLELDVSRIGFTEEFLAEMRPKWDHAFRAMADLEAGAIANPDEGRMVGHYWLRKPELAPNPYLQKQIVQTIESVQSFAADVVSGKVMIPQNSPPNHHSLYNALQRTASL